MNRPALRIAMIVVLADVAVTTLPAADWLVAAVMTVSAAWLLWFRPELASAALAMVAGSILGLSARDILPPRLPQAVPADRCRVEGTVTRILRADSVAVRVVVHGSIDTRRLPSMQHRALVTIGRPDSTQQLLRPGQHVIAYGTCEAPPQGNLTGDRIRRAQGLAHDAWWHVRADAKRTDVRGSPWAWQQVLDDIRRGIAQRIRATFPADVQPLIAAVLTGDERGISIEDRTAFARTGTAHMFSVSGSHVAIIASVLTILTSWLRHRWRAAAIIAAMAVFVGITGAQPPAVRALLAAACVVIGLAAERDVDGMNLLGAAVAVMVVIDPALPWRVSVQLSVGGVAGILLLATPLQRMLDRMAETTWPHASVVRTALAVSMAASAGVALPSAIAFGSVTLISPLANLLVVPLLSAAMLSAAAAVILPWGSVYAPFAMICVRLASWVSHGLAPWHSETTWPVTTALLLVLTTLWLINCRTLRELRWRLSMGLLTMLAVMTMPDVAETPQTLVRADVQVWTLPRGWAGERTLVVIRDRRPAEWPRADRALADWLRMHAPLTVLEQGLCAGRTIDMVEDSADVVRMPLHAH
ncbi:MAG: ComEC family competence protein [Candidatus Kapabacteria bacterium]|nr:ComEC family competence protein [Candidatus Kapabacteria bacterium]